MGLTQKCSSRSKIREENCRSNQRIDGEWMSMGTTCRKWKTREHFKTRIKIRTRYNLIVTKTCSIKGRINQTVRVGEFQANLV